MLKSSGKILPTFLPSSGLCKSPPPFHLPQLPVQPALTVSPFHERNAICPGRPAIAESKAHPHLTGPTEPSAGSARRARAPLRCTTELHTNVSAVWCKCTRNTAHAHTLQAAISSVHQPLRSRSVCMSLSGRVKTRGGKGGLAKLQEATWQGSAGITLFQHPSRAAGASGATPLLRLFSMQVRS